MTDKALPGPTRGDLKLIPANSTNTASAASTDRPAIDISFLCRVAIRITDVRINYRMQDE